MLGFPPLDDTGSVRLNVYCTAKHLSGWQCGGIARTNTCQPLRDTGKRPSFRHSWPASDRAVMSITFTWSGQLILLTRALEGGAYYAPHLFFANNLKTAARSAAKFGIPALTIYEHTLCGNFDFLGQKVRSPGQVKVRCAPRDRLQTSTSRCGHSYSPNDLKL